MRENPREFQLLKSVGTLSDEKHKLFCRAREWDGGGHFGYLTGGESWNELCYIIPVNGLGCPPQRAQNHVQDQDIVVIGEVVVVQTEAAHLCKQVKREYDHLSLKGQSKVDIQLQ